MSSPGDGYRHLNTETSPGHAALSTGAPPRVTGVVGNRWFVRAPGGTTRVVSSIEQPPPTIQGPAALRVPIRRLDRQIGRILTALEEKFAPGEVLLALSADHGFSPIPEALHKAGETRTGGRPVTSDRTLPTFQARVSRMLASALCLNPRGADVLATDTSWNLAWAGPFPQRTIEGSCGPSGREVSRADMSHAAKRLILNHFAEEVEEVMVVDEQAGWPASQAVEMARNVLDIERIGDVLLIPRPHALVHWDPARGSGHGSHHDYDTHVPLIFLGAGFSRGTSSDPVTPYDLAPTLGAAVGIKLPQATGRSLLRDPR